MINLIPNTEKKIMRKNFYYRLSAVFFGSLALVMIVASVALTPAYFLSEANIDSATRKLEIEKENENDPLDQEALSAILALDKKLSIVEKAQKEKFIVSERVVSEILANKMPDIKVTRISFEKNDADGRKISIRGTASSRERLLLFRHALENDPLFKQVDLPISNFVKGSNIQFFLSLMPS